MCKREHLVDFQATQINSIFNFFKKPDLRSISWIIYILGEFVKEENETA